MPAKKKGGAKKTVSKTKVAAKASIPPPPTDVKEDKIEGEDLRDTIKEDLASLNKLSNLLNDEVGAYVKKKGPLSMEDVYKKGPITNCGTAPLITTFNPCPPLFCLPQNQASINNDTVKNNLCSKCCRYVCTCN